MKKYLVGGVTLTQFAAYNDDPSSEYGDSTHDGKGGNGKSSGAPLTFEQKMAQRMSSEGYQNRKPNITIPGGAYTRPGCMSRQAYARLNPNYDRSEQLNMLQQKNGKLQQKDLIGDVEMTITQKDIQAEVKEAVVEQQISKQIKKETKLSVSDNNKFAPDNTFGNSGRGNSNEDHLKGILEGGPKTNDRKNKEKHEVGLFDHLMDNY